MTGYLALSKDKVASVRIEFSNSIPFIKPYLELDLNLNIELMEIMNELKGDSNKDVIEAIE